jgi:hypothetical protein
VEIPEGSDINTPLGLFCERGYVIPVGAGWMHLPGVPADNQSRRQFDVVERGVGGGPGPIESHAKTCTCILKVKPFDLRTTTCKQP